MSGTIVRFGGVEEFERRAFGYLTAREAEHNLIIGLCGQIRQGLYSDPYLAVVETEGRIAGAALRTPPHNLLLSRLESPDAVEALARDVNALYETLPGVLGRPEDAAAFARRWEQGAELAMRQRIYSAERCTRPSGVAGGARRAVRDDRDLLVSWAHAFMKEAMGADDPEGAARTIDRRFGGDAAGVLIWEDGGPVSMAGFGGRTPNGVRIGLVYTPPERRGRGYASACVAALTQELLDEGRRFCFLYTDLANPTSNKIYPRIGYEPVCDVDQYRFT